MDFKIEGKCVVHLRHEQGENTSKVLKTDINLIPSKNIQQDYFLNKGVPTAKGTKALTQCFVQGLVGNIHQAHQKGYWDSAEHLRYIIQELERGFIAQVEVRTSHFDE